MPLKQAEKPKNSQLINTNAAGSLRNLMIRTTTPTITSTNNRSTIHNLNKEVPEIISIKIAIYNYINEDAMYNHTNKDAFINHFITYNAIKFLALLRFFSPFKPGEVNKYLKEAKRQNTASIAFVSKAAFFTTF